MKRKLCFENVNTMVLETSRDDLGLPLCRIRTWYQADRERVLGLSAKDLISDEEANERVATTVVITCSDEEALQTYIADVMVGMYNDNDGTSDAGDLRADSLEDLSVLEEFVPSPVKRVYTFNRPCNGIFFAIYDEDDQLCSILPALEPEMARLLGISIAKSLEWSVMEEKK